MYSGRTRKCTSILHCNCNSSTTSSENYLLYHHQAGTSIPTDLNCPNWGSKLGCQNSRHSSSTALLLLGRGGLLLPLENRSPSFMLHFCETGLFISKLLFLSTALQHYKNWWATTITGNTQYLEALGLLLLSYFTFSGGWEVTFQY